VVWWMLHAQHVAKRTQPLTITGPAGTRERVAAASEVLFPGSSKMTLRFPVTYLEYSERQPLDAGPVRVTPFEVSQPAGAPPYALRLETEGKVIAFSGDTEWVEALIPASDGADLYIAECYAWDGPIRYHTSWEAMSANLARITARRILLTHMSHGMLKRTGEITDPRMLLADDGLVVEV